MNGASHDIEPEISCLVNGGVGDDSVDDGEEKTTSSTASEDGIARKGSRGSQLDEGLRLLYSIPSPRPVCLESGRRRKLILHLDIRNTILVADSVFSINVEHALNSYLSSVTWGRETESGWEWFPGPPSLKRPGSDEDAFITYYKHLERKLVKTPGDRQLLRERTGFFTDEDIGRRFRSYFDTHLALLKWGHKYAPARDANLTMLGSDNQPYHYILPSLYRLFHFLAETNRDFAVVLRTYGMDAENVLSSLAIGLRGKHPDFRTPLRMPIHRVPGKVHRPQDGAPWFEVMRSEGEVEQRISFPRDIYRHLSNTRGIVAFKDDFPHWQNNKYNCAASKPFWIDLNDDTVHHIFFDDNFRPFEDDSIVDVMAFAGVHDQWAHRLSMEEVASLEDVCLVQADLLDSTANPDYFIEKVKVCEQNYSQLLKKHAKYSPR